ncbi:MAG TPA: alpha/beta family hydrolase [Bryobacteraceae bacterium]|nr:alpha/beta family hydrolase [Bryobacteraceae bacterium]
MHEPGNQTSGDALAITHGAGSNGEAPLLRSIATEFAAAGYLALRFDLPYRRARPHGPPFPAQAARDREGIREAVSTLRKLAPGRVFAGGHSYGGRQTSMAAAEDPALADGLLLLSYPLHPPDKPRQLRTEHFDQLRTPAFFAHGTRDPFGSIEEMRAALAAIPARTELMIVEGAPHGIWPKIAGAILANWTRFIAESSGF